MLIFSPDNPFDNPTPNMAPLETYAPIQPRHGSVGLFVSLKRTYAGPGRHREGAGGSGGGFLCY